MRIQMLRSQSSSLEPTDLAIIVEVVVVEEVMKGEKVKKEVVEEEVEVVVVVE